MKKIQSFLIAILVTATIFAQQEIYTESSAASITNEANSLGSLALVSGTPTLSVSTESDTGNFSFLLENTNNENYKRARVAIPVTNATDYRVIIKFKTENEIGDNFGDGYAWIESGVTAPLFVNSNQTGWQIIDQVVTTNDTAINISFASTGGSSEVHKIWLDEISITEVSPDPPTAQTALDFDGGNDYVNLGAGISLTDYTIEAWVNWSGNTNYQNNIVSGNDTSPHAFWIPGTEGGKLSAGHGGSFTIAQDPVAMPDSIWTHVAVTYNATTGEIVLYKNGIQVASATEATGFTATVFYIGSYNFGYFFKGMIDNVRLWSVARSPLEISTNYSACLTGSEVNLVALYKFDDGAGSSVLSDSTANGHNGTLANMNPATDWITSADVCTTNEEVYIENSAVSKSPNETNSVGSWNAVYTDIPLAVSTDTNAGSYSIEYTGERYEYFNYRPSKSNFLPGQRYRLSAKVKATHTSASFTMYTGFDNRDNGINSNAYVTVADVGGAANEWVTLTFEGDFNGVLPNIQLTSIKDAGGGDEKVWLSELSITKVINDTQAPTAPTLSGSAQSDTAISINWTAATDDIGVVGYKVFKDGVLEATLGDVLTYQVTGLTANTSYDFTVTAFDLTGNESGPSNVVTVSTTSGGGTSSGHWSLENQDLYYNDGNVGIGTTTPDEKLSVNGNIHSKEVRVDLNGWPDYVFAEAYKLPTLRKVENYIKRKGHLKNIPSAKEVAEKGVLIGDMNAKLLLKIEELTLYIIQQQKDIELQEAKNKALEERLKKIEILLKN